VDVRKKSVLWPARVMKAPFGRGGGKKFQLSLSFWATDRQTPQSYWYCAEGKPDNCVRENWTFGGQWVQKKKKKKQNHKLSDRSIVGKKKDQEP